MKRYWCLIVGLMSMVHPLCLGQSSTDDMIKNGRALVCDRKYTEAREAFETALNSAPLNLEAAMGKIDTMGYLRKITDAESFVSSQFASSQSKAAIARAYIKIWKRDYDGAFSDLQSVTPGEGDAYLVAYLSGYVRFVKKKWDQAIPHLEKSVALNPAYPQSYFLLGDVFRMKNDAEKVTRYWGKYLEMVPKGNACTEYVNDYLLKIGGR